MISRWAGWTAICSIAWISCSVIGTRVRSMFSALRRVVGLVKIMRCFWAKRNSERSAAMVVRRGQPRNGSTAAVTSEVVISRR